MIECVSAQLSMSPSPVGSVDSLDGETENDSICPIEETCTNHLIAFAAEESRVTGKVIDMDEYRARFN